MALIYHITSAEEWRSAQDPGTYESDTLLSQGFIHCSDRNQVVRVANHVYRNVNGLVLLHIDTGRLKPKVVYENLDGGQELFPHLYGPLNTEAVVRVTDFQPGPDGRFDRHDRSLPS